MDVVGGAGSGEMTVLSTVTPGWKREAFYSLTYYPDDDGINPPTPTPSMEQGLSSNSSSSFEVVMNVLLGLLLAGFTLLTVVGNALVLHAVRTDRKLQTVCNMFIVSLAVADLVVGLIVMPISAVYVFTKDWLFGVALCQLWIGVDYTASTASILNLLILSLDRYWSVTNPLKYLRKRTRARGLVMISVVWVLSSLWIIPIVGWHHFINEGVRTIPSTVCDTEYARSSTLKITTSILNFYLPLAIMYVLYIRIFVEIRRRSLIEVGGEVIHPQTMTTTTTESFSSESLHDVALEAESSSVLEQLRSGRFLRRPSRLSLCLRQRQRSERSGTRKSGHFSCRRQMSEPMRSRSKKGETGVVCCSTGLAGKAGGGGCGGEIIAMERLRNRIYDRIASRKDGAAASAERTGNSRVLEERGVDERCEEVLLLKGMSLEEDEEDGEEEVGDDSDNKGQRDSRSSNDSPPGRRRKLREEGGGEGEGGGGGGGAADDGETTGTRGVRRSPLSKETWDVPGEYVEGMDSDSVFSGQLSGSRVELTSNQKGENGRVSVSRREPRRATALLDCLLGHTVVHGRETTTAVDKVRCLCGGHDGHQTPLCELPAIRNIKCGDDFNRTCPSSPSSSVSSRHSDYSGFNSRVNLRNVHGEGSAEEGAAPPHRAALLPKEAHPVKGRIINRSVVNDSSSLYRNCSHRRQNPDRSERDAGSTQATRMGVNGIAPLRASQGQNNQTEHTRRYLYLALAQRSSHHHPDHPHPAPTTIDNGQKKQKLDRSMGATCHSSSSTRSSAAGSSSLQKEIKAARQVGVIMGAFTICFLPYFVCFTVVSVCEWCNNAPHLMTAVTWFGYLNSTLNPFLYPLCNVNFRRKFRQMLSPGAAAAAAANNRETLPISRQMSVRGGASRLQPAAGSRSRPDSILDLDRN